MYVYKYIYIYSVYSWMNIGIIMGKLIRRNDEG